MEVAMKGVMIRTIWVIILLLWSYGFASAHEVRPGYLKMTQTAEQSFDAVWKQPITGDKRLKISPVFPQSCDVKTGERSFGAGTLSQAYQVSCDLMSGQITIEGLERTLTDVFVEINFLSGDIRRDVLKPAQTTLDLAGPATARTSQYLSIGVEHILFGWDHLLFVIGLVLLVSRRQILGVATAFTLAHSLTLALAAFGLLRLPTRPVEILIAMSIVLLAVEIVRKHRGEGGLSVKRPYLIGFLIGLIHGCGFASALANIGLPKGTELLALLLFNIGVEIGQFVVIGLFLIFLAILGKIAFNHKKRAELVMTYAIGAIAMFWVIDRAKDYII